MRRTRLVAMAGVVAALLMAPVTAQALSFTIDPSHIVVQGGSVDFNAALTIGSGDPDPLNLLGISITLSDPGLTADDSVFLVEWPLQLDSSNPGVSDTFAWRLFTVSAAPGMQPGTYSGSVTLVGGDPTGAQFELGTQDFSVTVKGLPPVPEPATLALLAFGLAGLATRRRTTR